MPADRPPTVCEALREEARPVLLARLRWTLYLGVASLILDALSDLRLTPVPRDLVLLKLAGAGVQLAAVVILTLVRRWPWPWLTGAMVVLWSLVCAVVAVNGGYTADPIMPMFLLPVMVLGASLVFPWGPWPQLAMVLAGSAILLPQALQFGTNLVVSVYSVLAVSVYVAAAFERRHLAHKAIELLQAGQQRVLEHIAADAPIEAVFSELLATLQQQVPDSMCTVLLLDDHARELGCAAVAGLPDGFRNAVDRIALGTNLARSVAAAAVTGRAVAGDIAADALWAESQALALSHGLRSSWSEPIRSADRSVLGAVAVYRPVPHAPSEAELAMLAEAARLLGVALERHEGRRQLERYVRALDDARVQAEAQSVQLADARDQALASMRARSQFLANMSHEIRTPLNGIIGTTDILLDTPLNPTQREYARILSQCGEHLLGVINDVLDFSKIEAGKVDIERLGFDLRALVEEVADLLAVRAQDKGIELVTSIPPELDGTVKGDPYRLRQVLVNLVGNAIKFTERGEVVIEGRVLRDSPSDCTVRLSVRDTGIGIPPERQAAVFESFTQADGSTTRTHGGSGLGLTISRELVRLMGGEIGLESTPGLGSEFWIDIRFERVPAGASAPPPSAGSLAGRRVLVVDDTAVNRLILRQSMQHYGCRVDEAASGRDALALLDRHSAEDPFDLVLLDMQMPELDGIATARFMKAHPRLAGVPVVLLSSIGGIPGGEAAARAIGFAAVVTKPVRRSTLLNALRTVLDGGAGEPTAPPAAVAPRQPLGLRVLLAEDNHVNQLVAQRLLEKLGCEADVVDTGRAAVEAVARARYDVVLMDVQMPQMDGFEAAASIRRGEAVGTHVPIIAMTAHAMEGDRERCLASGMDGYISKPVKLAALAEALGGLSPARDKTEPSQLRVERSELRVET